MSVMTEKTSQKKKNQGPPDGGYGWVVLFSGAVGLALITGLARVAGFVYVSVIEDYGVTRAEASVVFMVARFLSFGSTPITTKLLNQFNYATLISTGGFILFISLFLSSFTTSLWQLIITYGVIIGIAVPLVMASSILAVTAYFKKRRPLAIGLYFAMGGASGLIIPLIFEILLDKYGLSGSFLIYSALLLNICPFGLLILQPNWLPNKPQVTRRKRLTSSMSENANGEDATPMIHDKKSAVKPTLQRMLSIAKDDISIFKDPIFLVMLLSRISVSIAIINVMTFIPDFVDKDLNIGLSKKDIAMLISATAIGDIIARAFIGTVIDKLPWHKKYSFAVLSACVGLVLLTLIFARNYALLLTLHIAFGLLLGIIIVLSHVLEADLMGPRTGLSYGITQSAGGTASVIAMYIVGYFRDVTGKYTAGFIIMGTAGVLGGLVWLLEPCFRRCLPPRIEPQPSMEKFPDGGECLEAV